MRFQRILLALLVGTFLAGRSSYADVLAEYQFTNNRTSNDISLTSVASTFDNGSGFSTNILTGYQTTTPSTPADPSLFTTASDTNGTTEATAVSNNDYYTFTLTPAGGLSVNLTSLAFRYALDQGGSNGSLSTTFFVRSSVDNFATTVGSASVTAPNGTNTTSFTNASISLTASQFQNLSSAVTFHIYIYDSQSTATRKDLLDDVILNGTLAAVPEPSTYAMMGLGVGLLGAIQRFRRRRS